MKRLKQYWNKFYRTYINKPKSRTEEGLLLLADLGQYKLWTFAHPENIPLRRLKGYSNSVRESQRNITSKSLEAYQEKIREALNKQEFTTVAYLNEILTSYLDLEANESNILSLGSHTILINDEPINEYSAPHNQLKSYLFTSREDVRDVFFYLYVMAAVKDSLNSITSLKNYLNIPSVQKTQEIFLTSIRKQKKD